MTAYQAPLSLGFSRQERWSGLLFPSPLDESEKWKWSRSVVSDLATLWTAAHLQNLKSFPQFCALIIKQNSNQCWVKEVSWDYTKRNTSDDKDISRILRFWGEVSAWSEIQKLMSSWRRIEIQVHRSRASQGLSQRYSLWNHIYEVTDMCSSFKGCLQPQLLLSLDFCDLSRCPDHRDLESLWEFQPVETSESYKERCIFINVHAFCLARVGTFSSTCISVVETVSTAILIYCITKVTMRVMETHPLGKSSASSGRVKKCGSN